MGAQLEIGRRGHGHSPQILYAFERAERSATGRRGARLLTFVIGAAQEQRGWELAAHVAEISQGNAAA